jgi:transcriptional regulator with XRE-family HTH domain
MRAQLSTSTDMELGSAECDRLSVAGIDEEADAYAVGERIRARRKELKISAADLARAIGAVPHTIWRYEKKGMMPSAPALQKLAEVLKVTERYLSTGADASVEASVEYDEAVRTALLDLLASWDPILGSAGQRRAALARARARLSVRLARRPSDNAAAPLRSVDGAATPAQGQGDHAAEA